MNCQDGFYSDQTGLAVCTTCPEGQYCDQVESQEPIDCIEGSDCDLGSKRQPNCPAGTYQTTYRSAGVDIEACLGCPETFYCRAGKTIDLCVAGYVCETGFNHTVPNPSIGQCPEGHYCPKGSRSPTRCPFETMSVETAQR